MFIRKVKIRDNERGFLFKDKAFVKVLKPGVYRYFDPFWKVKVDAVSVRDAWILHKDLEVIVKSGVLKDEAQIIDLKDNERGLVWVNGRFDSVLRPGLYALWTVFHDVRVEIVDASNVMFEHADLNVIRKSAGAQHILDTFAVESGHVGLFFKDGEHVSTLQPGTYVFWKNVAKVKLHNVDLREKMIDVVGQDIMTEDKVTLRLNAIVAYKVVNALKTVMEVEDKDQTLYREAQLALRAVIGTKKLDDLLTDKDAVSKELEGIVKNRANAFGVDVVSLGIRDIILPGDMKDLLNKVTEARKAAEANLITRREEIAAMRSQANTAKILESNPTLMRLRELEVLEKVAGNSKLNVVLGEKGLADKIVNLL